MELRVLEVGDGSIVLAYDGVESRFPTSVLGGSSVHDIAHKLAKDFCPPDLILANERLVSKFEELSRREKFFSQHRMIMDILEFQSGEYYLYGGDFENWSVWLSRKDSLEQDNYHVSVSGGSVKFLNGRSFDMTEEESQELVKRALPVLRAIMASHLYML